MLLPIGNRKKAKKLDSSYLAASPKKCFEFANARQWYTWMDRCMSRMIKTNYHYYSNLVLHWFFFSIHKTTKLCRFPYEKLYTQTLLNKKKENKKIDFSHGSLVDNVIISKFNRCHRVLFSLFSCHHVIFFVWLSLRLLG